jgi:hypothetical protein
MEEKLIEIPEVEVRYLDEEGKVTNSDNISHSVDIDIFEDLVDYVDNNLNETTSSHFFKPMRGKLKKKAPKKRRLKLHPLKLSTLSLIKGESAPNNSIAVDQN